MAPQIRTFQDLFAVLKRHARDPDFHNLVEHTQVSKLPVDVSVAGFAMLLRTAFEGFAFSFSRRLFLKNSPKGEQQPFSTPKQAGRTRTFSRFVFLSRRAPTSAFPSLSRQPFEGRVVH